MRKIYFLGLIILTGIISCRQRYEPKVEALDKSFLVVDGNLNGSHDTTIIRLTRTSGLDEKAKIKIEDNAQITVEGKDNTIRPVTGRGNGYYMSPDLNLIINNEYRLRIKTSNGKEYLSEYIKTIKTPLIDSISHDDNADGVEIFANTHDPSNATKYYRWDYDETWELHSYYFARVLYDRVTKKIRDRDPLTENVYNCWKYDTSKTIVLANSTKLADDIIYKAPIRKISATDEKLMVRYSIHVRQYALDKTAYDFFEGMKRNTEDIGNLFSPQPYELRGNIHCVSNPEEYVLGYVTASTIEKKRIFITYPSRVVQDCPDKVIPPDSLDTYFTIYGYQPYEIDLFFSGGPKISAALERCVDCTKRSGLTRKPYFW